MTGERVLDFISLYSFVIKKVRKWEANKNVSIILYNKKSERKKKRKNKVVYTLKNISCQ